MAINIMEININDMGKSYKQMLGEKKAGWKFLFTL